MGTLNWLANDSTSVFTLQLPRSRSLPYSTLFENNRYIRALNKLLQLELGLVEVYRRCADTLYMDDADNLIRCHQQQARNLVNLIVSNRGIPDQKGFSLSPELGLLATGISRHLWQSLAFRTSRLSCLQLERLLLRRYRLALGEAPFCDRSVLDEHIRMITRNVEQIVQVNLPNA